MTLVASKLPSHFGSANKSLCIAKSSVSLTSGSRRQKFSTQYGQLPKDVVRSLRAFPSGSNGEFNLPPELLIVIKEGNALHFWFFFGLSFHLYSRKGVQIEGHQQQGVLGFFYGLGQCSGWTCE
eukprot:TRINITY_DN12307_c0_g1_i2.p1 TRINITY_DN12307_c0_g1~~TRINITY_DN12307_c0_g1_i2.p1  ORF type:complete len:137 (+),score=23.45 TRINITY_DN12307_c0_g1_i2:40-411(+)